MTDEDGREQEEFHPYSLGGRRPPYLPGDPKAKMAARAGGLGAAKARQRIKRLDLRELGPLESDKDEERWLTRIAQALAQARLSPNQGNALMRVLKERRAIREAREVKEYLEREQEQKRRGRR